MSRKQKMLRQRYESTRNSAVAASEMKEAGGGDDDDEDDDENRRENVKVKYSIVYFNWAVSDTESEDSDEEDDDKDGPVTNVTLPLRNLKLSS